ncbi:MAG: DUF4386 family protein [Methanobacterium sp.]|uniref:hypothetical protein n=1 Tax=Methanobacterium sp. TaxID=2164 RepID=UPI003D64DF8C|nr:DUF4386 family protein [Methanobacterium sp.]
MKSVNNSSDDTDQDFRWNSLYKIGGAAAIISALLLLIEIIVFTIWPQPATVLDYFTLLQTNKLIGLIDFYLLEVIAYILFLPMFLAIYLAIRRFNESYMIIAIFMAILGIAIFLSTNNSFSMLNLSNQFVYATTGAQKSMILAAGQSLLVNTGQRAVGGFNMGLLLISFAGIIMSTVMLKSNKFGNKTAYIGILAFTISLAEYVRMILLPGELILLLIFAVLSGVLLMIWLIMVGRRLLQLSQLSLNSF